MRTALTRQGREVVLNQLEPVAGGWRAYVLNAKGHAVSIFVPEGDLD